MAWASFGTKLKINESTYNKAVAGGQSLKEGFHKDVRITAIELKTGENALNIQGKLVDCFEVTFESDDGKSKKNTYFPVGRDFNTGADVIDGTFIKFCQAVAGNPADGLLLIEEVQNNDKVLNGFIGARVSIKVGLPKKGQTVKVAENGAYIISDIESGENLEDKEVFSSLQEAMDYAKENGYKLRFTKVLSTHFPSEEYLETNKQIISSATSNKNKSTQPPIQAVNAARL